MNYKELNQIEIKSFLSQLGFQPVKQLGNRAWYLSPYRNEKTASFSVAINQNVWYDFGEGRGGSVIRLASILWNLNEKDTCDRLIQMFGTDPQQFSAPATSSATVDYEIHITKNRPITSQSLRNYIKSRKIPLDFATQFLREIHYHVGSSDNEFFALGLKNDHGGFELRNRIKGKDYKRTTRPKHISTVHRTDSNQLNLFEGMFDFLSAVVYYKGIPAHTSIVLNSVNQIINIYPLLARYRKINLYLDNDSAGQEAVMDIRSRHSNCENHAIKIYPAYKDFNEFLCK